MLPFCAQGDAFKTLFVSRISFETTEKKLKREFEEYGPIKRIRLVQDAAGTLSHLHWYNRFLELQMFVHCVGPALLCLSQASREGMRSSSMNIKTI